MTGDDVVGEPPVAVVVMGVAGSGKSTLARALAERLGYKFVEADDIHPPTNLSKLMSGVALTDEDRLPWLGIVADEIDMRRDRGVVVACSALRRAYRDRLRCGGAVFFIQLTGTPELHEARLNERQGHFMPSSLLRSQLITLEPLQPDEEGIVLDIAMTREELVDAASTFTHTARSGRTDE